MATARNNQKKSALSVFQMPTPVKITGRTSTITNSFVNAIIPSIMPSEVEVQEALNILGQSVDDLRCVYCGDSSTEWDHLRSLVRDNVQRGSSPKYLISFQLVESVTSRKESRIGNCG